MEVTTHRAKVVWEGGKEDLRAHRVELGEQSLPASSMAANGGDAAKADPEGMLVGALGGLVCCIMAGAICQDMSDFREAMRSVRDAVVRGSIIGVTLGGMIGMAAQWMIREYYPIEAGFILGVIIGFILGTLIGGITVAAREAYGLVATCSTERDAPREMASPTPSITITLHNASR